MSQPRVRIVTKYEFDLFEKVNRDMDEIKKQRRVEWTITPEIISAVPSEIPREVIEDFARKCEEELNRRIEAEWRCFVDSLLA